jgi:predicted nucleic acid-binding protein
VTLYVDSSAFLKRYLNERDSAACERLMDVDQNWASGQHTMVEVRRILARKLGGASLIEARHQFDADWARTSAVALDEETCAAAAEIAELTGSRSLDALHLGAMARTAGEELSLLTYDIRQAATARSLGWLVLGA